MIYKIHCKSETSNDLNFLEVETNNTCKDIINISAFSQIGFIDVLLNKNDVKEFILALNQIHKDML